MFLGIDLVIEIEKYVRPVDGKFCVYSKAGEQIACHPTRREALEQLAAIEANKSDVKKSSISITENKEGGVDWSLNVELIKSFEDEEQIVAGIVYEPDVVDAQGDSASAAEIRKAAHRFMMESETLGIMHKEAAGDRARIVETFLSPAGYTFGGQQIRKGSWVMVVKILDKTLWDDIKTKKITGFSMGGRARSE